LASSLDGLRKIEQAVDRAGALGKDALRLLVIVSGLAELQDHAIEGVAKMIPLAAGHFDGGRLFELSFDDLGHPISKVFERLEQQMTHRSHDDANPEDRGEAQHDAELHGDVRPLGNCGRFARVGHENPSHNQNRAKTGDQEAEGG